MNKKFDHRLWCFLIVLSFMSQAMAQQLFIRNQPYEGEIVRRNSRMLVNLDIISRASRIPTPAVVDGKITVGNKELSIEASPLGNRLIDLEDFVEAANLILKRNAEFNTIDVYAKVGEPLPSSEKSGKGSKAWEDLQFFLSVCQTGSIQEILALCDGAMLGDGRSVVPAEPQVRSFLRFLEKNSLKLESEGPSGEYTQFIFKTSGGGRLIINMLPLRGKYYVTGLNMRG